MKGVRETFRIKIVICAIITAISIAILYIWQNPLINLYLHDGSSTGDLAATLKYGKDYLWIMLIGLLPFSIEQAYSSTLRETGETVVPMRASLIAVFVNLVFNYILIYGKFGAPVLGVQGAAIATVLSRFVQMFIVVFWSNRHTDRMPYFIGAFKNFSISMDLVKKIAILGAPLLVNETLWAAGITTQTQCYSIRGLSVIAALNISSTITNVFNIVFIALGDAVAIIVGQQLGRGDFDEAKDTAYKIITFSVMTCVGIGGLLFLIGPLFPKIYNTSDEVKSLASNFIRCAAACMPLHGYLHSTYFTLRSGGKTIITFLFDSFFLWVVAVPLAYVLTHFTGMDIVRIYLCCLLVEGVKVIIGAILLEKGVWMNKLVEEK